VTGHSQPLARRLARIAAWIGAVVLFIFVLDLLGVPAADWIRELALNGFLPANIGIWVMLLMLTTLIAGATFAMVFSTHRRYGGVTQAVTLTE
jgi:hypothetical protein